MNPAVRNSTLGCALAALATGPAGCASAPPAPPPPANLDVYVPPSVPSWPDEPPADESDTEEPEAAADAGREPGMSVWEGEGVQNDGQRWPMQLRVTSASVGDCASVVYPARPHFPVECVGDWLCEEGTAEQRLVGVERITEGTARCIDGCLFDANLDTGSVQFACADRGVTARVELTRVR